MNFTEEDIDKLKSFCRGFDIKLHEFLLREGFKKEADTYWHINTIDTDSGPAYVKYWNDDCWYYTIYITKTKIIWNKELSCGGNYGVAIRKFSNKEEFIKCYNEIVNDD